LFLLNTEKIYFKTKRKKITLVLIQELPNLKCSQFARKIHYAILPEYTVSCNGLQLLSILEVLWIGVTAIKQIFWLQSWLKSHFRWYKKDSKIPILILSFREWVRVHFLLHFDFYYNWSHSSIRFKIYDWKLKTPIHTVILLIPFKMTGFCCFVWKKLRAMDTWGQSFWDIPRSSKKNIIQYFKCKKAKNFMNSIRNMKIKEKTLLLKTCLLFFILRLATVQYFWDITAATTVHFWQF